MRSRPFPRFQLPLSVIFVSMTFVATSMALAHWIWIVDWTTHSVRPEINHAPAFICGYLFGAGTGISIGHLLGREAGAALMVIVGGFLGGIALVLIEILVRF